MKLLAASLLVTLALTTGFTCSKNAPQEPNQQEQTPPPAQDQMGAPADQGTGTTPAPAEGTTTTPAPAEGTTTAPAGGTQ